MDHHCDARQGRHLDKAIAKEVEANPEIKAAVEEFDQEMTAIEREGVVPHEEARHGAKRPRTVEFDISTPPLEKRSGKVSEEVISTARDEDMDSEIQKVIEMSKTDKFTPHHNRRTGSGLVVHVTTLDYNLDWLRHLRQFLS